MPRKRITQDTQLLLQLDLLRNEAEMRQARLGWRDEFWLENAAGYLRIEMAHGTKESAGLRQVATYCGMAASLVLDDILKEKTLFDPAFSQELFTVFSKVRPFLKELPHQRPGLPGERGESYPQITKRTRAPPTRSKASGKPPQKSRSKCLRFVMLISQIGARSSPDAV